MDDPSRPSISLAMAVRNGAPFVDEALRGIEAQTIAPDQIVLVDDGSDDTTLDTLDRFRSQSSGRVTVLSQPRLGLAAARNTALKASHTTWQIILDADDVPDPVLVEKMLGFVQARPRTATAFCRVRYVDENLTPLGFISPWPGETLAFTDFLQSNPMHSTSGTIINRDRAIAAGGFDEGLTAMADVDMAIRIGQMGGALHAVDEVLVSYRKHKNQVTTDWRRLQQNWERLFDKALSATPHDVAPMERGARAQNAVYWATMAYQTDDFTSARRLMRQAWMAAPGTLVGDKNAWVRSMACLATRLPRSWHDALQRRANAIGRAGE